MWYERENECQYSAGDTISVCKCRGDIDDCTYTEFGLCIGQEETTIYKERSSNNAKRICKKLECENCDSVFNSYSHFQTRRQDHKTWEDAYLKAVDYLKNEFYIKMKDLSKNYLSQNNRVFAKYMRKLLDKLDY